MFCCSPGPIVLALVAMVSPFVALKLRLRDAREMIRTDLFSKPQ
jgi:hypothetical protein